jgi:hypothetical protein
MMFWLQRDIFGKSVGQQILAVDIPAMPFLKWGFFLPVNRPYSVEDIPESCDFLQAPPPFPGLNRLKGFQVPP